MKMLIVLTIVAFVICSCRTGQQPASKSSEKGYTLGFGSMIYCWHVEGVGERHGVQGYVIHDGKTGYVPVCIGHPFASIKEVGTRLKEIDATNIVLAPYFPGIADEQWKIRSLTATEQQLLGKEVKLIEIQNQN